MKKKGDRRHHLTRVCPRGWDFDSVHHDHKGPICPLHPMRTPIFLLLIIAVGTLTTGCLNRLYDKVYYNMRESLGTEKRDILVDRVVKARGEQQDAAAQFRDALEEFRSVVNVRAGELEGRYDRLNAEYKRCKDKADRVTARIDAIEDVSEALFREWRQELAEYQNKDLRRRSERQLEETRGQYDRMIAAMRRAEKSMNPVLAAFRDQVLFLKHNLNAAAIASLRGEFGELEGDINALIAEMEASIAEADKFLARMQDTAV